MSYSKPKKQPAGLADNEVAVLLEDGTLVAVSCSEEWSANGAGAHLQAFARWLDAKGNANLCPAGQEVRTQASVNVSAALLAQHGLDALRKEMLLLVLGEEPTMVTVPSDEPTEVAMLDVAETNRLNWSIRHHAATVTQMRQSAHPSALLDL